MKQTVAMIFVNIHSFSTFIQNTGLITRENYKIKTNFMNTERKIKHPPVQIAVYPMTYFASVYFYG